MRKNTICLLLIGSLVLLGVSFANARGTAVADVANTIHNFSASAPLQGMFPSPYAADVGELNGRICVYCHTPHGGSLDAPLWNRKQSPSATSGYQMYTSETLSLANAAVTTVNSQSLICLSCHDGSLAIGDGMIKNGGTNASNLINFNQVVETPQTGGPGSRVGASLADINSLTDLRDDHPISVSYTDANTAKGLEFKDTVPAELLLFGSKATVECATCHDPHVDYNRVGQEQYAPFLAMSNDGSAMCLACHTK